MATGRAKMEIEVEITVTNNRSDEVPVTIPAGTVFEAARTEF